MNQKGTKISFQQRLAESFQKHPHHVAIESGDDHITYSQLESRANRICHWITGEGIPPESFIGVCFDHSIDIIPVIIGILKARCVFIILDTALPRQRLLNMIRLTHLQIVFTCSVNKKMLFADAGEAKLPPPGKPSTIILVDEMFYRNSPVANVSAGESGPVPYHREDKIYIYFTSGTTGMPRAFVGKNKSLLHFIDWEIEAFGIDETFRFSQWVTPGFDAFLRDIFTPLCAGAVICTPPRKVLEMAGPDLVHWLNARHICLIHCVPSIFRLLNTFTEKDVADENFKALKMIVMAGEKIIPHELTRWFEMFAERIQLINLYGTSETTMAKTCYFMGPADGHKVIVPVGKPIPGARVLILDENMQVCPKKFVGQIYIRTPFRTHGYYNDPLANKEKFIPNPFSTDVDDWLHKTGDQGRLLQDDNIEVLGRVDRQVKIRGIRVEPEEIENILLQHPAAAEVAVIDRENNAGETYLCAYFVSRQNGPGVMETTARQFEEYLAAHLPSYMVPAFFIPLEKMPLTSNGKINLSELPEPSLGQGDHYLPPAGEMEEKLAVIWSQVLHMDKNKISMDADFFRMGGHSLNATILMSKIHRQLGIKVPLAEIFKNPTIRGFSHYLNVAAANENRLAAIEPVETREYYPLSPAQKRLYFLQQLDAKGIAYNMPMVQPLGNAIAGQELETILKKLIARHETLRTSFIQVGNEPYQKVHEQVTFAGEYYDLAAAATGATADTAEKIRHIIHSFIRPFDLSRAPLLRSGLIRLANGDYIWLVDIHHIVTDGTSQDILTKDFFAFSQGRELAPLPLQYTDFSQWQNRLPGSNAIKAQQDYWLSQLTGEIPRLNLPVDYKRPGRFT
ncbi:MAG TPA: AMP-binding protein, partial [Candidatus Deferrimicrobium sp.]|nr:AMP-binding protein [Candidatus Deferrimicrobium sp.]